jgi:hypothetical protein
MMLSMPWKAPTEKRGHAIVKWVNLRWGYLLTIYFWFQTFFGWVLTTLRATA